MTDPLSKDRVGDPRRRVQDYLQHKPDCPRSLPNIKLDLGPGWTQGASYVAPCSCGLDQLIADLNAALGAESNENCHSAPLESAAGPCNCYPWDGIHALGETLKAIQDQLVESFYDPDPADVAEGTAGVDYAQVDWCGVIRDARAQIDKLKAGGPQFPQDQTAVSSVLGDTCPRCGGQVEYDEVDIGVGTMRGNPGCPDCHWVPEPVVLGETCPRCGTPGDQDDCPECHPARPRE